MTRLGIVLAFLVATLLASIPLYAQGPAPPAVSVGIVGWPADPADTFGSHRGGIEQCLTERILELAPEIVLVPQRVIRDALFPLLEPSTQPATEEAFTALLAREDVRTRLAQRGLHYLISFTGGPKRKTSGGILCSYGGCLGFKWTDETTELETILWSLGDAVSVQHESTKAIGTTVVPTFILPVPIPAGTKAIACRILGEKIVLSIRQVTTEQKQTR